MIMIYSVKMFGHFAHVRSCEFLCARMFVEKKHIYIMQISAEFHTGKAGIFVGANQADVTSPSGQDDWSAQ